MAESRAAFTVITIGNLLIIVDRDLGRTVTNDADRVVAKLVERGHDVDACVIVYLDTAGRWDQLLTAAGRFCGFRALLNPEDVRH